MCRIKQPATPMPEQAVYAEAPKQEIEAPKLQDKKDTTETAQVKANRRGVRALRTDLGGTDTRTGLGIPVRKNATV